MAVGLDRLQVQESCATLPTFQPEDLATQAPVTDGGFLDTPVTESLRGNKLIDSMTRIPLPITPVEDNPVRPLTRAEHVAGMDEHHAAVGRAKLLAGDLSSKAIRFARIQWVNRADHHFGYHDNYKAGLVPPLPKTEQSRFTYAVLASAGFLPDKSIGFNWGGKGTRPQARIDELTLAGREMLWERGDVAVDKIGVVSGFLADYCISRATRYIRGGGDKRLLKWFLDDPRDCAEPLLRRMVQVSIQPSEVPKVYAAALANGSLPPGSFATAHDYIADRLVRDMNELDPKRREWFDRRSARARMLEALAGPEGKALIGPSNKEEVA